MLEKQRFNREMTGDEWRDGRKFRQRLSSINDGHAVVAPYAYHMRVILHEDQDTRTFADLCKVAGLQDPIYVKLDACKRGFFAPKRLYLVREWVCGFDWSAAFQIEALLHNGLLHTDDLDGLKTRIEALYGQDHGMAADTLRHYTEALRSRDPRESPLQCFNRVLDNRAVDYKPLPLPPGCFACHHVTFTPTRIVLEGPYILQSNRVIRQYPDHQEHFIRVDFRDEDRLQYRWAREVGVALSLVVGLR